MGMFDSLHSDRVHTHQNEWQTKAYDRVLAEFDIGDVMPDIEAYELIQTYQVEVLGGAVGLAGGTYSFATVSCGVLAAVPVDRDPSMPLFSYGGFLVEEVTR